MQVEQNSTDRKRAKPHLFPLPREGVDASNAQYTGAVFDSRCSYPLMSSLVQSCMQSCFEPPVSFLLHTIFILFFVFQAVTHADIPQKELSHLRNAVERYENGAIESARVSFERFLEKYPSSRMRSFAELSAGLCFVHEGEYKSAIILFSIVVAENPSSDYLAICRTFIERIENRKRPMKDILGVFSLSGELKYALAARQADKIAATTDSIKSKPAKRRVIHDLKRIAAEYENTCQALKAERLMAELSVKTRWKNRCYKRFAGHALAIARTYGNEVAIPLIAQAAEKSIRANDWDAAIAYDRVIVKNFPPSKAGEKSLLRLAQILRRQKNDREAVKEYRRFIRLYPKSKQREPAHDEAGIVYAHLGKLRMSNATFQRLQKRYPGSRLCGHAQFQIGSNLFRAKKYYKAIEAFQKLVQLYPTSSYVAPSERYLSTIQRILDAEADEK